MGGQIGVFRVICVNACNQDQLLPVIVEYDYLVKEHQIHIPEIAAFVGRTLQTWLCVLDVVVGEIAHEAAGKRRKPFQLWTFIFRQNVPYDLPGVFYGHGGDIGMLPLRITKDPKLACAAGELQRGGVTQKRVSAPGLPAFGAFQQIAVPGSGPECPHDLDGGEAVGKQLHRDGDPAVFPGCAEVFYL